MQQVVDKRAQQEREQQQQQQRERAEQRYEEPLPVPQILALLPATDQRRGVELLVYLLQGNAEGSHLEWDSRGVVTLHEAGEDPVQLRGAHITELINYAVRKKRLKSMRGVLPTGWQQFLSFLALVGAPKALLGKPTRAELERAIGNEYADLGNDDDGGATANVGDTGGKGRIQAANKGGGAWSSYVSRWPESRSARKKWRRAVEQPQMMEGTEEVQEQEDLM